MSKYNELVQDIQDETSYFLPVDALSAGTHRYLYHLGDFSAANAAQMQRFLDDKREALTKLEQGKLSNSERRSVLVLRPYLDSLSTLIGSGYFGDTLWQLRNARRGLYQVLYMTEIPMYVRGKALVRRLEELSTPPTAPAEQVQLRSGSHQELALEESHIIDQYLLFAEDRASRFDDKQAISERIFKAREYMSKLEPQVAHSTSTGESTRDPVLAILLPSLDEASTKEAQEHLEHETEALKRQLGDTAARIDASRSTDEVVAEVLRASLDRHLDQSIIDDWMSKDYARLHRSSQATDSSLSRFWAMCSGRVRHMMNQRPSPEGGLARPPADRLPDSLFPSLAFARNRPHDDVFPWQSVRSDRSQQLGSMSGISRSERDVHHGTLPFRTAEHHQRRRSADTAEQSACNAPAHDRGCGSSPRHRDPSESTVPPRCRFVPSSPRCFASRSRSLVRIHSDVRLWSFPCPFRVSQSVP